MKRIFDKGKRARREKDGNNDDVVDDDYGNYKPSGNYNYLC